MKKYRQAEKRLETVILGRRIWKTAFEWARQDLKARPAVAREIADAGAANLLEEEGKPMRVKSTNLGGKGRRWILMYQIDTIENDRYRGTMGSVSFNAVDSVDAKKKLLTILKRIVSHTKSISSKLFVVNAFPNDPLPDKLFVNVDETIRLKRSHANRRLLGIRNPEKVLVQGYGPEVLKRLGRATI
jgi:hypothetical protein